MLEEWRGSKDSNGRTQEASFKFMMDGCKVSPFFSQGQAAEGCLT